MTQRERLAVTDKNAALEQLATGVVSHFKSLLAAFQGSGERIGLNPDAASAVRPQPAESRAAVDVMEPSDARTSDRSLAIVPLIVERAGGYMSIESAPGRGTTFKVFFPRIGAGERPSDRGAMALASQS